MILALLNHLEDILEILEYFFNSIEKSIQRSAKCIEVKDNYSKK